MIRPDFLDPESRKDLTDLARDGSVPNRLARRANALLLLDGGMTCEATARLLFIDADTVREYRRLYQTAGVTGVDEQRCRDTIRGPAVVQQQKRVHAPVHRAWRVLAHHPKKKRPVFGGEDRSAHGGANRRSSDSHRGLERIFPESGYIALSPEQRLSSTQDAWMGRVYGKYRMDHLGGCHCRNLTLRLRLTRPPADNATRSCACSFCRAHATRTVSDPDGRIDIRTRDWSKVTRYRFSSGTADFLLCQNCGIYIGAVCETATGWKAVTNVNSLDERDAFPVASARPNHDDEPTEARIARRAANWTPATLHGT